ncbi:MAG: ABC transporter permease [Ardenticatenaceae bacterium]|nr:ABC transporter permease [Ardenticatenaceae bacterium]
MSETIQRNGRFQAILQNPVTMKELRSRMRGRRAFVVLTVYLLVMSLFLSLVYLAYASASSSRFGPDSRQAGKAVFAAVLGVEVFLVIFIAPAFTAGAITGEKERQTYDLLRTTLLPANWFVLGKLLSALSYVFLLIFASIPLQSISFLLGGLSVEELVIGQLLVLAAAVTFALFGLYCSSVMKSTLAASVVTFGGALFWNIGMPILVFMFAGFLGSLLFGGPLNWVTEAVLYYAGLTLSATNLLATMVISETALLSENTLFFFTTSVGSPSRTITIFSPWPLFLILYTLASLLLYWACVRRVKRIADK